MWQRKSSFAIWIFVACNKTPELSFSYLQIPFLAYRAFAECGHFISCLNICIKQLFSNLLFMLFKILDYICNCIPGFIKYFFAFSFPFPYLLHLLFKMPCQFLINYFRAVFFKSLNCFYSKVCCFYCFPIHISPLEQCIHYFRPCSFCSQVPALKLFYYRSWGISFWRGCFLVMQSYFFDCYNIILINRRQFFFLYFDIG